LLLPFRDVFLKDDFLFLNLENILKRGNLLLNSPFMVDKDTGEIHEFGTAYPIEKYLQDYEEKKNNLS